MPTASAVLLATCTTGRCVFSGRPVKVMETRKRRTQGCRATLKLLHRYSGSHIDLILFGGTCTQLPPSFAQQSRAQRKQPL
eukprot:g35015.t1